MGVEVLLCNVTKKKRKSGILFSKNYVMLTCIFRWQCSKWSWLKRFRYMPVAIKPKLNIRETFTRSSTGHMNALYTFNLGRVFTGIYFITLTVKLQPVNWCFLKKYTGYETLFNIYNKIDNKNHKAYRILRRNAN